MGQKINPIGFRLGINRTWDSRWFADNAEYGKLLHEDLKIRKYLLAELKQAGISKVVIERPHKKCRVTIHAAEAKTAYGICGVKVWIFKGEILEHDPMASERRATEGDASGGNRRRENA